jgi:hypothetical protein
MTVLPTQRNVRGAAACSVGDGRVFTELPSGCGPLAGKGVARGVACKAF